MLKNPNPTHPDEISSNKSKTYVLAELEKNFNIYNACREAGITRALFYTEWKKDEVFQSKLEDIKAKWIDGAESNLMAQAVDNKKAYVPAIFMLKSHKPEVYDRQSLQGQIHGNVTINIGQIASETMNALDLTGKATAEIED